LFLVAVAVTTTFGSGNSIMTAMGQTPGLNKVQYLLKREWSLADRPWGSLWLSGWGRKKVISWKVEWFKKRIQEFGTK
jgi:hypothetical protein